jgi:hypothetical protein
LSGITVAAKSPRFIKRSTAEFNLRRNWVQLVQAPATSPI